VGETMRHSPGAFHPGETRMEGATRSETFAERFRGVPGHPFEQGFDLRLVPEALDLPLRWKKSRLVFVNSMSDLFHEDVPDSYIEKVFAVMRQATQHRFQVLTKRAERLESFTLRQAPSPNVWLGVSVENADYTWRIDHLRRARARVRFLSIRRTWDEMHRAATG
jgi:protein gp37